MGTSLCPITSIVMIPVLCCNDNMGEGGWGPNLLGSLTKVEVFPFCCLSSEAPRLGCSGSVPCLTDEKSMYSMEREIQSFLRCYVLHAACSIADVLCLDLSDKRA